MLYALIYNPVSGNGKSHVLASQISAELDQRGDACRLFETQGDADGVRQAKLALEARCDAIVCIGGDGTFSEVVSVCAGKDILLLLVPCGTGNDFARVLKLPADPMAAFHAQLSGKPAKVDCASVNGRPFINVSGSGFDVDVLRKTEELKSIYPGDQAYRKAVLSVITSYKPFEAELTLEDGETRHIRATICEFANGIFFGGGMRVAPKAKIDDGLLDVIVVGPVPSFAIPLLLPLFILGWHVWLPFVKSYRVRRGSLRSKGMTVNIDGRLSPSDSAVYEIMPGALTLMRP